MNCLYGEKNAKGCAEHRKALVKLVAQLDKTISNTQMRILKTLVEIQRLLHLKESSRTVVKKILTIHNSCYHNFALLKKIGINLKKLTRNKLYGKYLHNLLLHSTTQLRTINERSIYCENQEIFFNTLKAITQNTSSYKPGHIIGNCFIHKQIEHRVNTKPPKRSLEN